jgi:hypothetical protein
MFRNAALRLFRMFFGRTGRPVRPQRRRLCLEELERRETPAGLAGLGTGLVANYFSDPNLTRLVGTRTDATVNFDWGTGAPIASAPADGFSARWTGKVQAQFSETGNGPIGVMRCTGG